MTDSACVVPVDSLWGTLYSDVDGVLPTGGAGVRGIRFKLNFHVENQNGKNSRRTETTRMGGAIEEQRMGKRLETRRQGMKKAGELDCAEAPEPVENACRTRNGILLGRGKQRSRLEGRLRWNNRNKPLVLRPPIWIQSDCDGCRSQSNIAPSSVTASDNYRDWTCLLYSLPKPPPGFPSGKSVGSGKVTEEFSHKPIYEGEFSEMLARFVDEIGSNHLPEILSVILKPKDDGLFLPSPSDPLRSRSVEWSSQGLTELAPAWMMLGSLQNTALCCRPSLLGLQRSPTFSSRTVNHSGSYHDDCCPPPLRAIRRRTTRARVHSSQLRPSGNRAHF